MNEGSERKTLTLLTWQPPFPLPTWPRADAKPLGPGAGPRGPPGLREPSAVAPPLARLPPPPRFRIGPVPAPEPGGRSGCCPALATSGALELLAGGFRASTAGGSGAV